MNSVSGEDFFGTAAELVARGERFATVTVVRAERPTSGKPGDKAIVTENGEMVGFVGGSCAEHGIYVVVYFGCVKSALPWYTLGAYSCLSIDCPLVYFRCSAGILWVHRI